MGTQGGVIPERDSMGNAKGRSGSELRSRIALSSDNALSKAATRA